MPNTTQSQTMNTRNGNAPRDFSIIGAHLLKAHQSNEAATQLQRTGALQDARAQSKLTRVFINNALARINQQCGHPDA